MVLSEPVGGAAAVEGNLDHGDDGLVVQLRHLSDSAAEGEAQVRRHTLTQVQREAAAAERKHNNTTQSET